MPLYPESQALHYYKENTLDVSEVGAFICFTNDAKKLNAQFCTYQIWNVLDLKTGYSFGS